MGMIYRPELYRKLLEQVRVAGLALHAEGRQATRVNLRSKGVTGSACRIGRALAELLASGELPPECRCTRGTRREAQPTPSQIVQAAAEIGSHAPEVPPEPRPHHPVAKWDVEWNWANYAGIMSRIYGPGWKRLYRRATS